MPDDLDANRLYARRIVELWLEAIDFSQQAHSYFLRGEPENEITMEYIARLVRLWRELVPKVKNRIELQELEQEFMLFENFCVRNPKLLLSQPEKLVELEMVLTQVMDKLGLTQFVR
ncbi:MAG: hypothetical protein ABIM30_06000 [candidate division WOR-3 bacterium]